MAKHPSNAHRAPADARSDSHFADAWPAPAPAPIAGAAMEPEDTWMTFGLGVEGEEEDRTVTVVFARSIEESTEEILCPLSPVFPVRR
jgi:hypothetical protein